MCPIVQQLLIVSHSVSPFFIFLRRKICTCVLCIYMYIQMYIHQRKISSKKKKKKTVSMVAHRSTGLISYIAVSEDTGSPMRSLRNHREISVISHRYLCYSDENRCIYYICNHINQFLAYPNIPVIIRYENSIRPLQLRLGTGAARLRPRPLDCRWRNVPPFGQNLTDLPYHPLAFWSENNRVPSKKTMVLINVQCIPEIQPDVSPHCWVFRLLLPGFLLGKEVTNSPQK